MTHPTEKDFSIKDRILKRFRATDSGGAGYELTVREIILLGISIQEALKMSEGVAIGFAEFVIMDIVVKISKETFIKDPVPTYDKLMKDYLTHLNQQNEPDKK